MVAARLSSRDPYSNPELFRFADSMEGVPDFLDVAETEAERAGRSGWRAQGHRGLEWLGQLAPGLLLAGALALAGRAASEGLGGGLLGVESSPISPILIAILSGLLIRNTIGLPQVFERGLDLSIKRILRIGVALLGIKLSVFAVGGIGLSALPIVVACIGSALLVAGLATRLLSLPMRLGTLVAVGTAICGNTAIVATAPVIGASDDETSYAVGTITLFGLLALLFHPFIAHALFGSDALLSGIFLGTAIHDTAQVAGAGLLYDQQFSAPYALEAATVTKLLRNTFMILVIPLAALFYQRGQKTESRVRLGLLKVVPLFVIGFVLMAGLRTWGDLGDAPFGGVLDTEQWEGLISAVSDLSVICLTVAMAAVGLGTHLARLKVLGLRPLVVGLLAALAVGGVSALLLSLMGPLFNSIT
ncbi:MAG: putative sulfate exporter family transporter [Myxococcota bacterium]|nr:putative sulfate exporter family transporter [Myxococcota bacterium]